MQTKLRSRKWRSLVSSILLAASASSILIAPVFAAEYTNPLTGVVEDDKAIIKADGNKVRLDKATNTITYDFQGQDHTFTIKNADGIATNTDGGDYKYVFNNVDTDGKKGTIHIYQSNTARNPYEGVNGFIANGSTTTVNSNLDITATSDYASVGVVASGNGTLIINGNVKMRKDDAEHPWGIITKNVHGNVGPGGATSMGGDTNYTGARWQPAGISVDYSRGDITINGDVDIAVRGTAVKTDVYQGYEGVAPYDLGTISLVGNSTKIITPYREKNSVEGFGEFIEPYYALASYGGTINVNVKNREAQNGKVEMVGNVLAMKASDEAKNAMAYQNGCLNIGLTTQDSSWKGVIDNAGTTKAGEVNLWLQNGAQWIYENASRKDGLDTANLADYSRPYYEKYDGISHLSSLVGGKDKASAGIIKVNDNDPIHIANAEGVTKVWYDHADTTPGTIIGGDIKVLNAKEGTEMMLYTGNNGITKGFDAADTAAEKNNVSEVLNSLAHKLWYMAGDTNLKGSVSIAEGLTASSAAMKIGNITFAEGGQGFYDYTPEEDKTDYKTGAITESEDISKTRKLDINGVANVTVTESNAGNNKFASAIYAGKSISLSSPMTVKMSGKGLALNVAQSSGQAAAIYAGANSHIKVVNPSADKKLAITANNTDTRGSHGIYADGNAHLDISGAVEISDVVTKGDAATGINIQGKQSEINIDGPLTISNVKGIRERGKGINASGILVTGDTSSVTVTGPVDISGVRGSGIKLAGKDTKVSVGGGNITAAEDSDKSNNFYAVRVEKGTLDINMKDGAAGDITTAITGDMYVTGQYGKKVVEYSGGELIDWKDAGILNVALTNDKSFWKGVAAYDQYNSDYGSGGNTMHDIGQFNLYLQNGAAWTNEQQSHVTTTTVKNAAWGGSTLATLHGGKDGANAGLIYQKDSNPISVVNYSGHTTVFYEHDASDPANIIGGDFNITNAAKGSAITFVTDNTGITSGWNDSDAAADKNNVASVLNNLAGKLFYKSYADGNLAGVVKIADGLTASSAALKTGDISFSTEETGTKTPGQGYYDYKPSAEKPEYNTGAITKSEDISLSRELDASGVAHVTVTESNAGNNKFASAVYAGESTSPSSPMTVKMSGKGLALNVAQSSGQAAAIYAGANSHIKVVNPSADKKLAITANNTDTRGSHGIYADGNAHLDISGAVEISDVVTKGDAATGINIQGKQSEINIDGPLTISNVKGIRERGKGINASGILVTGDTSSVTVTGPVDISGVRGSGIKLAGKDTKVSVGGGNITAAEDSDKSNNFYAVRVEKGTLDINMKDGAAGDITTAITGDMYVTGQYGKKVVEYSGGELIDWKDAGILNVALTNDKSFWKGVAAYDQYNSDYGSGGNTMHDIGQFNLYLQNGAAWTNEQQSHVTTTTVKNAAWGGSTLASLHGGSDAAHAGHIFQNDSNNLTVVNYSGNTNIYYAHEGNGEVAENYKAGDTIIKSAAAGSEVSLITDNTGITMSNDGSVANVLNALAGKLTYSNFVTGEKNLVGYVKIAGGLTASSAALKTGDITFSAEDGKGGYVKAEAPVQTEFTTQIQGLAERDTEYIKAGITTGDQKYTFTKDSTITVGNKDAILGVAEIPADLVNTFTKTFKGVTVDAGENTLTLKTNQRAIYANGNSKLDMTSNITAGKLLITANETDAYRDAGFAVATGGVTLNVNADIEGTAYGTTGASYGLYAEKGSQLTVNGDITAVKENGYGIDGKNAGKIYGIRANDGTITVNGGVNMTVNGKAIAADKGMVNVNMNADLNGAADNTVILQGDVAASNGTVNLGLSNGASKLTGAVSGNVNLYLANGAGWDNSGAASSVAKLVGGAGNIFANSTNAMTIDNYSGNTNIFYAHDGNGEAAADYKAGDTVIKSAAAGSSVSLITDNKNVDMTDNNSVGSVLNALAGKLTYSNFATGEKNLVGYVKIADGLTSSSAAIKTGDISFDKAGKGFYDYTPEDSSYMIDPITGNLDKKYVKFGIETKKGIYNFTQDTTINVTKGDYSSNLGAIESGGGPITINADGYNLDVAYHVLKGSNVARAVATGLRTGIKDVTIKAKSLKLSTDTTGFYSQGVYATGGKITIDADTTISTSAQTESNGIYSGSGGTVTMNGNLDIQKDSKAANYIALKSDDNGVINVNMKDGKAGTGIVKIDGDVFTKSAESYDYWDDETTSTTSTVNLALQGKDSSWNGRSLYEVTASGDDSTGYGVFNLWLADGATWTNEKNGKVVPSGFTGSRVTKFTGGSDAAHAGNIFQNDTKNITIENYSGNTNIYYAHTGNGEAAGDYKAGDTIIKHAEKDSVVSMITDNSGIAMDNEYSVANALNALAGKLTYSNFASGEKNLTGYVKIADGLTASSKAMQTGDISFSKEDGKGSLKDGSMTPGITYPETQTPESSNIKGGITGDAKADYQYKKDGILKKDGSYVFTQDPTKIEVENGAAVSATDKDIVIDTTKAKLVLKGADAGIHANGADVAVKGNTDISGEIGINAANGNVTLNGSTNITGGDNGKGIAIIAGKDGKVDVNTNNGALTIKGDINANGGSITVDSGSATGVITGDVKAADGGNIEISLNDAQSKLTGSYKVDGNSSIAMNIKNGATWVLTDDKDEAAGMSLLRMAKAPAAAAAKGLTVNGGVTEGQTGYLDMSGRTGKLEIDHYSGWETIIYSHDNKGSEAQDFKSGNTVIKNAEEGSGVILFTDSADIDINNQAEVEAVLKVLAEKVQYTDHAANGANLKGKVRIAEGLTSSGKTGAMKWDEATGIGKFDPSSIKWAEIIGGDYETLVMKGVRSAATTSMHSWRDNMQDTYTGADLADEDGIFVKALGGKTSSDVKGVRDDNTYRGVQVGFDKALADGWHAGAAFDYRNGDSNYLLGGKGDNQLYSFGVYGVKNFADQSYLRVAAKAGRVENEYDVYNEIRTLKLHGDYKSNAYGLTMEYGKTFGTEASYFTPKAQLTWSEVGSKDYTAHTAKESMSIGQDAYSSLVARFGVEAGAKSEKGRVYVGLYGAHEFNGDISASYFAKDGGIKHTSFDGKDTWMEMSIGGSYDLSDNCHIYADFAKDFGGDFERKWKASAGLRFEF